MSGNGSAPHETIWQGGRRSRRALARLYLFAIGIICVVGIALAFYAIFGSTDRTSGPWVTVASVSSVPADGVLFDATHDVFVVMSGPQIVALTAADPASPERVYYCPSSGWFEAPTSGSRFDHFGFYREGSVARGLDRVRVRQASGAIQIRPSDRAAGPIAPLTDGAGARGPACVGGPYSVNAATGRWVPIRNAS